MSWLQRLTETYDACFGRTDMGQELLAPLGSVPQKTQLHVALWKDGSFRHAELSELENTIMFVTEDSAGRSGKAPAANPLTEQLEYCAAGIEKFGGDPTKFERYSKLLAAWVASGQADEKVGAVSSYIQTGSLLGDLIAHKVLSAEGGEFVKVQVSKTLKLDPAKLWVRWSVSGFDLQTETWSDRVISEGWAKFDYSLVEQASRCMLSGEMTRTTQKHPKRIRHSGDGAKLISSNDDKGYTFKGRLLTNSEALTVGYLSTQKAHNALRWLITRQGSRNADQVVVAWAVRGAQAAPVLADTMDFLDALEEDERAEPAQPAGYTGDAGQDYARRLAKAVRGYSARFDEHNRIVVMALDSATPGRMAILFYRELAGSEFLDRLQRWHRELAWPQNFGKERRFIGAPAPRDIAEAAYGRRVDDKLRKATVERLLPCIIDGRPLPRDLMLASVARATNRIALERGDFERVLGIACSLVRGVYSKEFPTMALDETRLTPDYLYGRLLAVADSIEELALLVAGETRETNAARLMQRFADHPSTTWRTIELQLRPYIARLRGSRFAGALVIRQRLLDTLPDRFPTLADGASSFTENRRLAAEFLLGYHSQRAALGAKKPANSGVSNDTKPEGDTE